MSLSIKDQVRLLISDVGGNSGKDFLFSDTEIENFLSMRGDSVHLAAATALRAIAGNEAQVSKRITFLELKTDGPAVAKELRELAKSLEESADEDADMEIAHLRGPSYADEWVEPVE